MRGADLITNETLSHILRGLKLEKCKYVTCNTCYVKKTVKQMRYDDDLDKYVPYYSKHEFLVVVENGIKKAIILNCNNIDLHWYVFRKYRSQHVLSNVLRTGIIREIWPEVKKITCCYEWDDDRETKYQMTKHLATLAGLELE